MNENRPPRRSLLGYILPYILMAGAVGLFMWLIFSNLFRGSDAIKPSDLDSTVLYYEYNATKEDFEIKDYEASENKLYYYEARHEYTTVVVSGRYFITAKNQVASFSVRIDEKAWNEGFSYTVKDSLEVHHAAYSSLFNSRIMDAKNSATLKANETIYKQIGYANTDAFAVSFWDAWGPTILTVGVSVLIAIFLFTRLSSTMNNVNGLTQFNKSPARRADTSKVRFSDVAGCDEEKAEMVELVEYLKDPKKYAKFGARLPKGFLLIGPPGTGKTLLAKAVAGEAGVPFYSISGSDFVEMYVGVGAGRVRDLFRQAKATAPCLIFIDEIDAVGRQRGAGLGGGNDEREQTLNQLLVEMDGFEANSGILVIAATNRDDVLDPALRRAGRFDRTITVSLPDKAGRAAILRVHARGKKISESVDFDALAKRTVGFSGADLDNVLNEAAILAVRDNKTEIGIKEIDEAIDRRIAGPAKSSKGLSPKERKQVAYHEAGHATIGINLPYSDKVQKITIVPRGSTGGHVLMTPEDDRFLMTKNELIARITGLLGGRTSEEIFFQDVSTGASNDIEQATRLARLMVTEFGMSELGPIQYERDTGSVFLGRDYASTQRNFSTQIAFEIDKAVRQIIDEAHANARKLLEEHKDQVILIAETLLDKETITAEEIESLCKTGKLPEAAPAAEPKAEEKPEEKSEEIPEPKGPEDLKAPEEPEHPEE